VLAAAVRTGVRRARSRRRWKTGPASPKRPRFVVITLMHGACQFDDRPFDLPDATAAGTNVA